MRKESMKLSVSLNIGKWIIFIVSAAVFIFVSYLVGTFVFSSGGGSDYSGLTGGILLIAMLSGIGYPIFGYIAVKSLHNKSMLAQLYFGAFIVANIFLFFPPALILIAVQGHWYWANYVLKKSAIRND